MLLRYFYFQTPQFVYYIIPMAVLVATLVTIGLMTKNSELIVMRACGISLYRTALPLLLFAVVLQRGRCSRCRSACWRVSNREADRLNAIIRGYPPPDFGALNRRWIVGQNGDIYHYDLFDPRAEPVQPAVDVYHLDPSARGSCASVTYARDGRRWSNHAGADDEPALDVDGARRLDAGVLDGDQARQRHDRSVNYTPFAERTLPLEPPVYFKTDEPDADADDVRRAERLHRAAAGQRLQRRAVHGAAAAEDRVPLRDGRS